MKSELSFLLELVLDDSIPKPIKTRLVARVRDVEKNYSGSTQPVVSRGTKAAPIVAAQSPSMQKIMEQNQDLIPKVAPPVTAAAAQALAARNALLFTADKDKPEPGMTSKRKI